MLDPVDYYAEEAASASGRMPIAVSLVAAAVAVAAGLAVYDAAPAARAADVASDALVAKATALKAESGRLRADSVTEADVRAVEAKLESLKQEVAAALHERKDVLAGFDGALARVKSPDVKDLSTPPPAVREDEEFLDK